MKKWELARYLIDAKKCVDSIMYIEQNLKSLQNINKREKVDAKRREFYINLCVVLDESFPKKKKELCSNDEIVERSYYERDKNCAHKDADYRAINYDSLSDMITDLQSQLIHVKELCSDKFPPSLTLDFVSHDRELFRLAEGLTAEKEKNIEQEKYPLINQSSTEKGEAYHIFDDTEDLRKIPDAETNQYATIVENGINAYEGLQNRQDFCIKTNVLHGTDMWATPNYAAISQLEELRKNGLIDKYDVLHLEVLSDPIIRNRIDKIFDMGVTDHDKT